MSSIEEGRKRQQAKQTQADKQQAPVLDLETVRNVVQEAVTESIQGTMRSLRDMVQQVVNEVLARQAEHQDLSAELGAIDSQLEAIRLEQQFIRTATELLAKASQARALASTATNRLAGKQGQQQEETTTDDPAAGREDGDGHDALPLPRNSRLPGRGRDEGPAPIDLQATQRQGMKS